MITRASAHRRSRAGGSDWNPALSNHAFLAGARWLLPYGFVWGGAATLISRATHQSECVDFCAVYVAWETYGIALAAVLLSALVAIAQFFSLDR